MRTAARAEPRDMSSSWVAYVSTKTVNIAYSTSGPTRHRIAAVSARGWVVKTSRIGVWGGTARPPSP